MFWRPCAATACLRASVGNPPGRLSTHLLVFFRALASLSFAERVCRWLAQLLFLRSCALGPCDLVAAWVQACVHFRSPTGCPRARSVLYASSFQQAFLAPAPFCKHLPPCRLSTRLLRFLGRPFSSSALCVFLRVFALFRSCRPRSLFALCVFFARFCIVSLFPDPFDLLDDLALFWVYPAFSGWSRLVRSRPHW